MDAEAMIRAKRDSANPAAAEYLENPYIVCTAEGVCVAPDSSHALD